MLGVFSMNDVQTSTVVLQLSQTLGNAGGRPERASAGFIIGEAAQVSPQGVGYPHTPGIHSPEQVEGWKRITKAVQDNGGRIFLQLWHFLRHHASPLLQSLSGSTSLRFWSWLAGVWGVESGAAKVLGLSPPLWKHGWKNSASNARRNVPIIS